MTIVRDSLANPKLARRYAGGKREGGSIAVMSALSLIIMLGVCGFALTISQLYNRQAEMQTLADAAALAAARQLDGTPAGITRATDAAQAAADELKFQYNNNDIMWSAAAIKFGSSPAHEGTWVAGATTHAAAEPLMYVKVDTRELDPAHGLVDTLLLNVLIPSASGSASVGAKAIAGRSTISVTPFAVCAMSPQRASERANPGPPARSELVEHGFRRGVSYDLMQLNPEGGTPANFAINPVAPPGTLGSSLHISATTIAPFVCSGTMAMKRVIGQPITVKGPFPLDQLFGAFNSRFNQYTGGLCEPAHAPPDENIKQYPYTSIPWMSTARDGQAALSHTSSTTPVRMETIADPFPALSTNTAGQYGPLWAFAKAVPFSSYVANVPEPATGYSPFPTSDWASLYKPDSANPAPQASTSYPTKTPYQSKSASMYLAPTGNFPGVPNRRVLNVPLLACPLASGATVNADVLAIGRFFMTVPATSGSLVAEFGGLAAEASLGGKVELYP